MYVLGIHNSGWCCSAALIRDGELVAACPEERLDRQKFSRAFPMGAIQYCLDTAGITLADIEHIGIGWNPTINISGRWATGRSSQTPGRSP